MGIFNSKNLKKAVNMVASSSPVINAISQATDIVDKSMDVIDKNLNGGKNWNFSETPKDEVAKAFMNGVRGKHIVCMMTNISDTAKASIRDNFNLDIDEQILFFNDTSFFGNKNQGIVITNKKLAWIPDNDEGDVYSFAFNDIERVEYREMQIYLWGYGNDEDNVHLPLDHFFSFNGETSAVKADAHKIAAVLNKMVTVAGHEEETTPLEEIESYLDNNEADKAIQCINEILSSTDFTDEDETKSIYYYYLGQCLGANEIRIKRLRGLDTASSEAKQLVVSGELDVKAVNVGGSFGRNTAAQNSYSSKDGMEMVQTYLPTKQPYCPDDLVWLDSETSWQALVKQRLNGNILSYSLHLSSSESVSMTSSKVLSVKASFEYLVTKVSGTYDAKTDKTFSKAEEIEWEIDMQFKPLQDFEDDNVNASNGQAVAQIAQTQESELSEDELAYKEEVEFCLEDASEIDAHSRKFLERKRQKLGLSETRAQEIEDMVKASLVSFTDEEKEYMEALDDVIEDGVIPDNVRRLLERERKSLGISEERAKELEEIKCKA